MSGDAGKILVAHRGASAYAPEHTIPAYRLAIQQRADYIEPDLQITRDGVLVAVHDLTLERTTNVEEVYPDRYREEPVDGQEDETVRRWYVSDFTLAELDELDAGSWFGDEFRGARIPTLDQVIELALEGGVGVFPETKAPEVYGELGFEMERLLLEALERHGLSEPDLTAPTQVVIQSFSPESLRILRHDLGSELSLTLLVSAPDDGGWLTPEGLERAATFADALGPSKTLILDDPSMVQRAHDGGLSVIPYTFRSDRPGDFSSGSAEMAHFLYELGVDGLFTNNPDDFPRRPPA
ncbi:MAG: glycerophosphodiester phosphodiesterase family protein [Longimicrobiales bacterium]|nr:glycerophosphodiester phosphodiesterase family protein [Longimicrobiales bacterium]